MNTVPHALALPIFSWPAAVLPSDTSRHYPAISLRVRANLTLRRLAVENARARAGGANRRANDDVRHAA